MDLSLDNVAVLNQQLKDPSKRKTNRSMMKFHRKNRKNARDAEVVVTGLGRIMDDEEEQFDARQKLNLKKTDARIQIQKKASQKTVAFDARSKIQQKKPMDARERIKPAFDARQKIASKSIQQQQENDMFVPKVTISGLGAFDHSSGNGSGDNEDMPFSFEGFRRTIQNDTSSRIRDLVITTKQAIKRRPSPIRPPRTIPVKQARPEPRPDPIRPQAAQFQRGNIVKLNKQTGSNPARTRPEPPPAQPKKIAAASRSPLFSQAAQQLANPGFGFKLAITNLSSIVTYDDILELFGSLGTIKRARLIRPGQAEVIYDKREDAMRAIGQYHLRELDGLPMNVVLMPPPAATPPTPPPAPTASQRISPRASPGESSGPLRLTKGNGSQRKMDIDPDLIHSALFKSKEKRPSKPVSFSITI